MPRQARPLDPLTPIFPIIDSDCIHINAHEGTVTVKAVIGLSARP